MITSTQQSGQDATHLTVVDNGAVRLVLDSSKTDNTGLIVYALNASSAWVEIMRGENASGKTVFSTPTITAVLVNHSRHVRFQFNFTNFTTTTAGVIHTFQVDLLRGIPLVSFTRVDTQPLDTHAFGPNKGAALTTRAKTVLMGSDSTIPQAGDKFNTLNTGLGTSGGDNYFLYPSAPDGVDIVYACTRGPSDSALRTNANKTLSTVLSTNNQFWIGASVQDYGLGDAIPLGNTDGQFREGEDNFTQVAGTWAQAAVAAASNGNVVRNTAIAANHDVRWTMTFPENGNYLVAIRANTNAGTPQVDVAVNGGFTGTPQTVPMTALGSQGAALVFGPFTVVGGDYHVDVKVTSVSSATRLDIDFVAIFLRSATSTTTGPFIPAKDLANSALRVVSPQ